MNKLINKNRKTQIMAKLQLSLQKYQHFKPISQLSESELLKQSNTNDQLTRELAKMLESNQRKKNDLRQRLISGSVGIDLNEQMEQIRQRMDILRTHHKSQRNNRSFDSLIAKPTNEFLTNEKYEKRTFEELYNMQKEKYAALRERRKAKRLSLQYLETVSNKDGRKERNKQLIEEKFNQQMRMLDEAINN